MRVRIILLAALAALLATVAAPAQALSSQQPSQSPLPEPLTLQQALDLADQANPDIQIARLDALESRIAVAQRRADLGPQLSLSTSATYQTSNLGSIGVNGIDFPRRAGPYRVFDARPKLTMNVFDASLLASIRAARSRAQESEAQAQVIAEQTRSSVIQLYLQSLQADSQARAADARLETAKATLAQVSEARKAGTSSQLDVVRAQQQVEQERALGITARRERDVYSTLLAQTLGYDVTGPVKLAPWDLSTLRDIARDAAALHGEAMSQRPELKVLQASRNTLQAEQQSAERERWPKIQAFGDYGVQGTDPAYALSTYSAGAAVTIPIWTSGRIENQIKAAKTRLTQWEQRRRKQVQQISQELTQALIEEQAARDAMAASDRSAQAAKETLELARLRVGAGLTTNLDIVSAQGNLQEAEELSIRSRYDVLLAQARLAQARGRTRSFLDQP